MLIPLPPWFVAAMRDECSPRNFAAAVLAGILVALGIYAVSCFPWLAALLCLRH
jgi:hypothetical protein